MAVSSVKCIAVTQDLSRARSTVLIYLLICVYGLCYQEPSLCCCILSRLTNCTVAMDGLVVNKLQFEKISPRSVTVVIRFSSEQRRGAYLLLVREGGGGLL